MSLSTREKRHQKTKQAILDAARRIIVEKGIDALSIRAIAKRIDYSPAGLYEYFGSKEEIVDQVVQIGHNRLYEYLSRVDQSLPPQDYIRELGLEYIQFATQNSDYFLLMFTHIPPPEMTDHFEDEDSTFTLLVQGIGRAVDQGIFKLTEGQTVLSIAYAHWGLVHGLAMLQVTQLSGVGLDFAAADLDALLAFGRGWVAA